MPAAARVAFVLALGLPSAKAKLAAVDPVDSMGVGKQTPPPVLMYTNQSWRPAACLTDRSVARAPRGPALQQLVQQGEDGL
jgi:chlorophyllase